MNIAELIRSNVRTLKPYSSARDEFKTQADVYMDANENPFDNGINRYPDPYQKTVKQRISEIKNISVKNIILGNGSDEVLDLIFRAFCEPQIDNIIICPPTYGMYKVLAEINNVEYREAPLNEDFSLNLENINTVLDDKTKLIFICSPNNPTGNRLDEKSIKALLHLNCIIVIDEAYIDFSNQESWLTNLNKYENLIVCQTLSKAWGMAGIRLGIGFSSELIINTLNKIKPPYNINQLTQQKALESLNFTNEFDEKIMRIKNEKEVLKFELNKLNFVIKIYPSEANFILVKVENANEIYNYLTQNGVVVRNRSNEFGCENCLRITIGTKEQNQILIEKLNSYLK